MNDDDSTEKKDKSGLEIALVLGVLVILTLIMFAIIIFTQSRIDETNKAIYNNFSELSQKMEENRKLGLYLTFATWTTQLNDTERSFVLKEYEEGNFTCISLPRNMQEILFDDQHFQFTLSDNTTIVLSTLSSISCYEKNLTSDWTQTIDCTSICQKWMLEQAKKRVGIE